MGNWGFKKILLFLCLYIILNFICLPSLKVKTASVSTPKIIFSVISDIHIGGSGSELKYKETLRQCEELYSNYDAIALVGDITNQGKEKQYETCMEILKSEKSKNAEIIVSMGNHEYKGEESTDKESEDRFVKETGMPGVYYDKWVKGYHFIVLSPDNGTDSKCYEGQLKWLNNKLKEKEETNKPIFVFLHQPFPNTVYGSNTWGQVGRYKKVFSILKAHPQVVFFSGHSHYSLEHPKTMYKKGFSMFNTGAIYYIMAEDDKHCNYQLNQGLFVEVYDKEVIVRCREFSKHQWIGKVYTVKLS
ncbi:MAG: metallophosphoesterase [Clostridiaceae bacterium]|nr:metallophosphoesterase [Clostridiaceae bacterium]